MVISLVMSQMCCKILIKKPDILIVGLGVPLQENWISEKFLS